MENNRLEYALAYARLGWHIFPLRSEPETLLVNGEQKVYGVNSPLTKNGFSDATTNTATIQKWWTKWPDANIGWFPWKSGHIVFDVDVKNGQPGREQLETLKSKLGELPPTLEQVTPSTGSHLVFKATQAYTNAHMDGAANIDIRCGHGYVAIEPSTRGDKHYKFLDWDPLLEELPEIPSLPTPWAIQLERDQSTAKAKEPAQHYQDIETGEVRPDFGTRFREFLTKNSVAKRRWDNDRSGLKDKTDSGMIASLSKLMQLHSGFTFAEYVHACNNWKAIDSTRSTRELARTWQRCTPEKAIDAFDSIPDFCTSEHNQVGNTPPTDPKTKQEKLREEIDKMRNQMRATAESIAHYKNIKQHIDGVALQGHHTVIYGPSGSFKTTFITALCLKAMKKDPELEVHYWGFDVSPPYITAVIQLCQEQGIEQRFVLFENKTVADLEHFYIKYVEGSIRMENVLIVLDTFKFLTTNVNDKNANKEAMHFVKGVVRLGAAWISIGHTNKNGDRESGTAEIEQDSDGLLRIDATQDGNRGIAKIKKGGRVRWGSCDLTIETLITQEDKTQPHLFWYHAIKEASLTRDVDIEGLNFAKSREEDLKAIAGLIRQHFEEHKEGISKTALKKLIKDNEYIEATTREIPKLLKLGEGKHWETSKGKENNLKLYTPTPKLEALGFEIP